MHNQHEVTSVSSIQRVRHHHLIPRLLVIISAIVDIICPIIKYCIFWILIPLFLPSSLIFSLFNISTIMSFIHAIFTILSMSVLLLNPHFFMIPENSGISNSAFISSSYIASLLYHLNLSKPEISLGYIECELGYIEYAGIVSKNWKCIFKIMKYN